VLRFATNLVAASGVKSIGKYVAVREDWAMRAARGNRSQYRIRFTNNTSVNAAADYIGFYSGNDATQANQPRLVITYDYP
jgi:hypothetical protein